MANSKHFIFSMVAPLERVCEQLVGTPEAPGLQVRLKGKPIRFVWCDDCNKYAKPRILSGLAAALYQINVREEERFERLALIEVRRDIWERLSETTREALMYEALAQLDLNEKNELTLRKYDIEVWAEVVRQYGLWNDEVSRVAAILDAHRPQLMFSGLDDADGIEESDDLEGAFTRARPN